jgi:hypothetical protein
MIAARQARAALGVERPSLHDTVRALRAQGYDEDHICQRLTWVKDRGRVREVIAAVDRESFEKAGGPVRRLGPWPVSYVRGDGERMFLVGAGHVIGERSLKAFGFFDPGLRVRG